LDLRSTFFGTSPCRLAQSFVPAVLLVSAALAQQGKEAVTPTQTQPLRVTTRLVQVSVVVHDKKGNPVTDLTRDDFVLLEESKPQQVEVFALESVDAGPRPAAGPPGGIYTNRVDLGAASSASVSVILLDGLNTQIQDQVYARQQIIKFLEQIQPQDRIALYALTHSQVQVIHDFSNDAASLLAALARYREKFPFLAEAPLPGAAKLAPLPLIPSGPSADPEAAIAMLEAFLEQARQRLEGFYITYRVTKTTAALEGIANYLASFSGRKNLIWVSASFPMAYGRDLGLQLNPSSPEGRTFIRETERAARALSNANVAVYTVDARGLFGTGPRATDDLPRRPARPGSGGRINLADMGSGEHAMQVLADVTGGRRFYSRNDVDRAIRSAIDDSQVSYTLGYYPTHGRWDGRFFKLKVKVKQPGLDVRARSGYYAADSSKVSEKRLLEILNDSARSPVNLTGMRLTVRPGASDDSSKTIKLDIDIDPRDLTLIRERDRWVGAVQLLLLQQAVDGSAVSSLAQTFDFGFSAEEYDQLQAYGLTINHAVEVGAKARRLRVVVRDAHSGMIGTVGLPLPVP